MCDQGWPHEVWDLGSWAQRDDQGSVWPQDLGSRMCSTVQCGIAVLGRGALVWGQGWRREVWDLGSGTQRADLESVARHDQGSYMCAAVRSGTAVPRSGRPGQGPGAQRADLGSILLHDGIIHALGRAVRHCRAEEWAPWSGTRGPHEVRDRGSGQDHGAYSLHGRGPCRCSAVQSGAALSGAPRSATKGGSIWSVTSRSGNQRAGRGPASRHDLKSCRCAAVQSGIAVPR